MIAQRRGRQLTLSRPAHCAPREEKALLGPPVSSARKSKPCYMEGRDARNTQKSASGHVSTRWDRTQAECHYAKLGAADSEALMESKLNAFWHIKSGDNVNEFDTE